MLLHGASRSGTESFSGGVEEVRAKSGRGRNTTVPEQSSQKASKEELMKEMTKLVSKMDVPSFRKEDPFWLNRNLSIRNANHPNFDKAMKVISQLVKMGVR